MGMRILRSNYLSMEWKIGMYLGSIRYAEKIKSNVISSP